MIELADSIISPETAKGQAIPQEIMHAQAVLGYNAGNSWPTYGPYLRARPDLAKKGWVVSTTLTAVAKARCYDIESGGGTNSGIPLFMRNADRSHGLPWLYTFASNGAAMLATARAGGFRQGKDFYYLSAHATRVKHICSPQGCGYPKSDGTQWLFAGSYDLSVLEDYMLPQPKPDPHAIFPADIGDRSLPYRGDERAMVVDVDKALKHPLFHRSELKNLYPVIKEYRDRIWRVSHFEPPDFTVRRPKPDWSDSRGRRWQELNARMERIAKVA